MATPVNDDIISHLISVAIHLEGMDGVIVDGGHGIVQIINRR